MKTFLCSSLMFLGMLVRAVPAYAAPNQMCLADAATALAVAHQGHELLPSRQPLQKKISCPQGGWVISVAPLEAEVLEHNHIFVATVFSQCRIGDTVADGAIYNRWTVQFEEGEQQSRRERVIIGHLIFQGDVVGNCDVEAKITHIRGSEGPVENVATMSRGAFCGRPVTVLEEEIAKRR